MAAMNAANIAKMANRSAPGSAQSPVLAQSSSGYFGGNSLLHQSNGNMTVPNLAIPSPSDQHLQSSLSDFSIHSNQQQGGGPGLAAFQQNMNIQSSNSMSVGTPTSAGPQNPFPDPNNRRSTPAPNQQTAQMQQMQKRKQFIQTLGSLMLQRGQPLPHALTGVPIPPGVDPNASPWRNLEPSQTEVGAIRLAGKDFDLYKFFGIVFQTGGGMKVRILSHRFRVILPISRSRLSSIHPISSLLRCPPAHMTFWSDTIRSLTGRLPLLRPIKPVHGTMSCSFLTSLNNSLPHTLAPPPNFSRTYT